MIKKMRVLKDVKITDIKEWDRNPRKKSQSAVQKLAKVIESYGYITPIIVDQNMIIRAGHVRYRALKKLGYKTIPLVVQVEFSSEDEAAAFALVDNKATEWSLWDKAQLIKLLEELDARQVNIEELGFKLVDTTYTPKTDIPYYHPRSSEPPPLSELVNDWKVQQFIAEIDEANITPQEKEFLKKAATRFYEFSYSKIAEYYAYASSEMKDMMEKLALVIIDYNKAILNGYIKLSKTLQELRERQLQKISESTKKNEGGS